MRLIAIAIAFLVIAGCDGSSGPGVAPELTNKVITGRLEGISATGRWMWGDGINHLCQEWSEPGFFYGTDSQILSSADVAVLFFPDILDFNNAESIDYSKTYVSAGADNTVLFRGRNGYFGAWKIDEITEDGLLYGTWYFRSGGGGDFTGEVVQADYLFQRANTNCNNIS